LSCRWRICLDGYCSTVQGLLDWFEVDFGFTRAFICHVVGAFVCLVTSRQFRFVHVCCVHVCVCVLFVCVCVCACVLICSVRACFVCVFSRVCAFGRAPAIVYMCSETN